MNCSSINTPGKDAALYATALTQYKSLCWVEPPLAISEDSAARRYGAVVLCALFIPKCGRVDGCPVTLSHLQFKHIFSVRPKGFGSNVKVLRRRQLQPLPGLRIPACNSVLCALPGEVQIRAARRTRVGGHGTAQEKILRCRRDNGIASLHHCH